MRDPNASDFCYYPFMQILITADGKYRPCSKHQDYITHDGRELSIHNGDNLHDAWVSDYMKDIRQHFLDNKQFEGCRECWRMQRMGLRSMRLDSYQYDISEEQVSQPIEPIRIEINSSNVCNLRCRICYPNASSKWIKEHSELYGSNKRVYKNLTLPNLNQVKDWGGSLKEICFFGGEPLLSDENLGLLDHFISSGRASNISLLFNTNGTVFNGQIAERLSHFKRVRMYFSIDDIEGRFEYQRKGADWNEVSQNIEQAYKLSRSPNGSNIDFKVCCTVSLFNVYYLPELFDWFRSRYPDLKIFWNFLFFPYQLNVQVLPKPLKEVIAKRITMKVKANYEMTEPETRTVEELLTYLKEPSTGSFEHFFRYVNSHDIYRKESFRKTFPEFWNLISSFCPADMVWGKYDTKTSWFRKVSSWNIHTNKSHADLESSFYIAFREFLLREQSINTEDVHNALISIKDIINTFDLEEDRLQVVKSMILTYPNELYENVISVPQDKLLKMVKAQLVN